MIFSPNRFPVPPIGNILRGIGKIAKYAWSVITGKDKVQEEIANKKSLNPEKSEANEIAELNKLLMEYRQNISAAANDMEREMIIECSMMLQEIMDVFEIFTKFPHETIMIKNGDVAIDGHSIMGFFSLDINKPVELVLSSEPTESFTNALSKYMVAA